MSSINAGTILAGKYRLESLVGRGGMGSVWRAEHLGLSAPVAVKLLDAPDYARSPEALARFHREARAAATIRSPHVVQIFDHGVDETLAIPFIVMELMEGESLAQRLARSARISPAEVARVFTQVARALSRAHEAGIVHRDLKPDNVFLVRNEDEEVAKVLDFGIAKVHAGGLLKDSATATGAVMGTAYYMSPEQITGTKNIDLRTDLWAFGVMACECLSGVRPFDADTIGGLTMRICVEPLPIPSHLGPVPPLFDAWFARSVSRDPAARFPSARDAAEALRVACGGGAAPLHSPLPAPRGSVSGAVAATSATTAGPLSISSGGGLASPASSGNGRVALFGLFAGALGLAGFGLWHTRSSQLATAQPSASAASHVVADIPAPPTPSAVASSTVTPVGPAIAVTVTPSAAAVPAVPVAKPQKQSTPRAVPASPTQHPIVQTAPPQPVVASAPPPAVKAPVRDVIDDRH